MLLDHCGVLCEDFRENRNATSFIFSIPCCLCHSVFYEDRSIRAQAKELYENLLHRLRDIQQVVL